MCISHAWQARGRVERRYITTTSASNAVRSIRLYYYATKLIIMTIPLWKCEHCNCISWDLEWSRKIQQVLIQFHLWLQRINDLIAILHSTIIIIWRAENHSGLTHKCWISPANLENMFKMCFMSYRKFTFLKISITW